MGQGSLPGPPIPRALGPPRYTTLSHWSQKVLVVSASQFRVGCCPPGSGLRGSPGHQTHLGVQQWGQAGQGGLVPSCPSYKFPLSWAPSPSQFTTSSCWSLCSDVVVSKSRPDIRRDLCSFCAGSKTRTPLSSVLSSSISLVLRFWGEDEGVIRADLQPLLHARLHPEQRARTCDDAEVGLGVAISQTPDFHTVPSSASPLSSPPQPHSLCRVCTGKGDSSQPKSGLCAGWADARRTQPHCEEPVLTENRTVTSLDSFMWFPLGSGS